MTNLVPGTRPHALKLFLENPPGLIGALLLAMLLGIAVFAPQISPYDPDDRVGRPFQEPGAGHLLGTNDIGQDILSEIIWGTRASLTIGVVAGMLVTTIGTTVGLVAGCSGGTVDNLLMRFTDLVLIVPFLPLMILLAAFLGPSFYNLLLVIGVLMWARPARIIRSQVLSLRCRTYVEAARAAGASSGRIMFRHILPGVLPLALAQFVMSASMAILIEASLSFLGLGDPLQKSWGSILFYAQARGAFITGAWLWWVLPPGLLITLTVMGFALTGFALDRYVNPRLNQRQASG
ncbi:MAG TPA: ABC transporter permease [Bacillota bacterium]|nr:ABC transporter permease [Bacillota bacterium]